MADFTDDIPEAQRETLVTSVEPASPATSPAVPWLLLVGIAVLGVAGSGWWWFRSTGSAVSLPTSVADSATASGQTSGQTADTTDEGAATTPSGTTDSDATNSRDNESAGDGSGESESLLGHRAYDVADTDRLTPISSAPNVQLKPEAAQTVEEMLFQAQAVGIRLGVISGFRSLEDQRYLFFELKAARGQTAQTRAEVSAPPGYSEHHTGYAVDFIDLDQPATDLNESFEQTPAFQWLEQNAAYYGFEMSFPKDNSQNIAYEPWHWRYVGNQESLELFYQGND